MIWYLIHREGRGRPARAGDRVTTSKEVECELIGATPPHDEYSSGRVTVRFPDGQTAELFPGAVGLEWRGEYEGACHEQ